MQVKVLPLNSGSTLPSSLWCWGCDVTLLGPQAPGSTYNRGRQRVTMRLNEEREEACFFLSTIMSWVHSSNSSSFLKQQVNTACGFSNRCHIKPPPKAPKHLSGLLLQKPRSPETTPPKLRVSNTSQAAPSPQKCEFQLCGSPTLSSKINTPSLFPLFFQSYAW